MEPIFKSQLNRQSNVWLEHKPSEHSDLPQTCFVVTNPALQAHYPEAVVNVPQDVPLETDVQVSQPFSTLVTAYAPQSLHLNATPIEALSCSLSNFGKSLKSYTVLLQSLGESELVQVERVLNETVNHYLKDSLA